MWQASAANSAQSPPAVPKPPQKDETPGWQAEGVWGQQQTEHRDCGPAATSAQPDATHFATLRDRLALAGWALHRSDANDGGPAYAPTRWGRATEPMGTLEAVAKFADRVGAPA